MDLDRDHTRRTRGPLIILLLLIVPTLIAAGAILATEMKQGDAPAVQETE